MQISNYDSAGGFVTLSDVRSVFGYVTEANAFRLLRRKGICVMNAGEGAPAVSRSDVMRIISGGSYTPAQQEIFVERLKNVHAVVGGLEKALGK